ncbi:hypothetical protein ACM20Q_15910, partial [Enterococcus casseliflavus]
DSNQPVNQDDSRELQKSLNGVGLNLEVLLGHAFITLKSFDKGLYKDLHHFSDKNTTCPNNTHIPPVYILKT